jgi:DNA-binding LacI/PurR family transcriptional regulator
VIAPFFTRPSVMERLRGVSGVLAEARHQLVLFDVERPGDERLGGLTGGLDGLLVVSLAPPADAMRRLAATGRPVVLVDQAHDRLPAVHTDDVAGGRLATGHLLELGHRRIAFLGDAEANNYGFTSSARRRAGYEEAMHAAGIELEPALMARGDHGREAAAAMTRELLGAEQPPTAIFAASDTQAVGVLETASALGVSVPGDLSIVGYDDIELARYAGLTTVSQPLEESGRLAAELLLAALAGEPARGRQLEIDLVVRMTTGPARRKHGRASSGRRATRRERQRVGRRDARKVRS